MVRRLSARRQCPKCSKIYNLFSRPPEMEGVCQDDGALLIQDGILMEVGPSRRLENLTQARHAIEINAAGRVVMPGFVDAHTHLAFPPSGIRDSEPAAAMRALHTATGHRLEARSRTHLEAMARHGTTTVEVKTACGRCSSIMRLSTGPANILHKLVLSAHCRWSISA